VINSTNAVGDSAMHMSVFCALQLIYLM
jgi:hypothetical protein